MILPYCLVCADMDCHEQIIIFSMILSLTSVSLFVRGVVERLVKQLLIRLQLVSLLEVCLSSVVQHQNYSAFVFF